MTTTQALMIDTTALDSIDAQRAALPGEIAAAETAFAEARDHEIRARTDYEAIRVRASIGRAKSRDVDRAREAVEAAEHDRREAEDALIATTAKTDALAQARRDVLEEQRERLGPVMRDEARRRLATILEAVTALEAAAKDADQLATEIDLLYGEVTHMGLTRYSPALGRLPLFGALHYFRRPQVRMVLERFRGLVADCQEAR